MLNSLIVVIRSQCKPMPKSQAIKLIIDKFFVNYMQKMKILGGYVYVFMSMLNII